MPSVPEDEDQGFGEKTSYDPVSHALADTANTMVGHLSALLPGFRPAVSAFADILATQTDRYLARGSVECIRGYARSEIDTAASKVGIGRRTVASPQQPPRLGAFWRDKLNALTPGNRHEVAAQIVRVVLKGYGFQLFREWATNGHALTMVTSPSADDILLPWPAIAYEVTLPAPDRDYAKLLTESRWGAKTTFAGYCQLFVHIKIGFFEGARLGEIVEKYHDAGMLLRMCEDAGPVAGYDPRSGAKLAIDRDPAVRD